MKKKLFKKIFSTNLLITLHVTCLVKHWQIYSVYPSSNMHKVGQSYIQWMIALKIYFSWYDRTTSNISDSQYQNLGIFVFDSPFSLEWDTWCLAGHQDFCRWCNFQNRSRLHWDHHCLQVLLTITKILHYNKFTQYTWILYLNMKGILNTLISIQYLLLNLIFHTYQI